MSWDRHNLRKPLSNSREGSIRTARIVIGGYDPDIDGYGDSDYLLSGSEQTKNNRNYTDTTAASCGQSQCMLDFVILAIGAVQGLGALTYIYCTTSVAEGGLAMTPSLAGAVMLANGLLGVLTGPFLAHGIDITRYKRAWTMVALSITAVTYLLLITSRDSEVVAGTLSLQGAVAAAYPPLINSISIGIVGPFRLADRASRNDVFKHVGLLGAAILPIVLITDETGYSPFFIVIAAVAVGAVFLVALIRSSDIDYDQARGNLPRHDPHKPRENSETDETLSEVQITLENPGYDEVHRPRIRAAPSTAERLKAEAKARAAMAAAIVELENEPEPIEDVLTRRDVLLFILCVICFHFANAAMLPQVGSKIDMIHNTTESDTKVSFADQTYPLNGKNGVSFAVIVAQLLMIPVAKISGWLAKRSWAGCKRTLVVAFLTLPVRGFVFSYSNHIWTLLWVQILDGVGSGAFGVISVLIVGDLAHGTGRFSLLQGVLGTSIGIGAACSNGIAGMLVEQYGFETMFIILASIGVVATLLLLMVRTKELAMEKVEDENESIKNAIALDYLPLDDSVY